MSERTATSATGRRFLFPWSDGDGLTAVLCDPGLWSEVFGHHQDLRAIRRAARKVALDQLGIGELVVRLLATRQGRRTLSHELKRVIRGHPDPLTSFVPNKLDDALKRRGIVLPARLYGSADANASLDFAALEQPESIRDWAPNSVLLAMSPLAMRKTGQQRVVVALRCHPEIAAILDAEAIAIESDKEESAEHEAVATQPGPTLRTPVVAELEVPRNDHQEHSKMRTTQAVTSSSDSKELSELSKLISKVSLDPSSVRSLVQLRDGLRQCLAEVEERVTAIYERQSRILNHLAELRTRPWLRARLPGDEVASFDDRESARVVDDRLRKLDVIVSETFSICARVEELATRVNEPLTSAPQAATDLAALCIWLREQAETFELQLSLLAENESRVQRLLQEVSIATVDSTARIIRTSAADIVLLGRVLVGDASCLGRHSDVGSRLAGMQISQRCLGLLLATSWQTSPANAKPLIQAIGRRVDKGDDVGEIVQFLVPEWWEEIVDAAPEIAFPLTARAMAAAIVLEDGTGIDYLSPCIGAVDLHRDLRELLTALRDARHRGELAGLRSALGDTASNDRRSLDAARARTRVLDAIHRQPGMTGHYHKLRVEARIHFLLPLLELVSKEDFEGSLAMWEGFGAVEELAEQTRRAYDRRGELSASHHEQLTNYLVEFDSVLRGWVRMASPAVPATLRNVSTAWGRLLEESARSNRPVATFVRIAREVLNWDGLTTGIATSYIDPPLCGRPNDGLVLMMPNPIVNARMTWSYPQAVSRGQVDIAVLFLEMLRAELGQPVLSLPEAVEQYLGSAKWEIAHAAAAGEASLETHVTSWMERRRAEIRASHADLLELAEQARPDDDYVDIALSYFTEAIQALDSDKINGALKSLEDQLRRFRMERDPHRTALVELLREAGERIHSEETIEELSLRLEGLRDKSHDRRLHLDELSTTESLPASLREAWQSAARRLDRPALWPSATTSQSLAEAIDEFRRYLIGHSEGIADDPATVNLLIARFEQWLPAQLTVALQRNDTEKVQTILAVARDIRRYSPATKILRMLGETAVPPPRRGLPPTEPPQLGTEMVRRESATSSSPSVTTTTSAADTVAEIRRVLRNSVPPGTTESPPASPDELRKLVSSEDWIALADKTAAAPLRAPARSDRLSGEEALFALALARSRQESVVEHHILGTLGIIGNPDAEYLLRQEQRTRFFVDALAVIAGTEHANTAEISDVLATALERLSLVPGTDPGIGHASQLFARLAVLTDRHRTSASVALANALWDVFKGVPSPAEPRSHLLYLLYRLRHYDALKSLASDAKPFDVELMQCITAFDRAESAPEVRPRTLQISAAIRERSKGRNKPWTRLFTRLESGFATDESSSALRVNLLSSLVDTGNDGKLTLQIQLVPPLHDAPVHLNIDIAGSQQSLLVDDEPLLKEKTLTLVVPGSVVGSPGDESRVPYRITGHTILNTNIDIRDVWTVVPRRVERIERLTNADIQRAWPGAKGDPVTYVDSAVFGREAERKHLRAQLLDGERPQSVMIFGQRRVGKTSLLWQMIDELPPRPGAVAGVFVDVSGVDPGSGSFARALVTEICSALDYGERNEGLRHELERQTGQRIEVTKLLRNLQVDNVYYALEGLVDRLRELSRGAIHHLALFIDEFDRFVEPLLSGRGAEVKGLLWQIRQVAQQSRKVALVLAGSGLQRLLSDDYNTPLFGSIAQFDIGPFRLSIDTDYAAIQRTFLPPDVRKRLCREDELPTLIETAYELTRGYPYYLAMLGYSAALLSPGFQLTPAMLHRAADEMIRGNVPNLTWRVDAGNFYLHIFETAERLPPSKQAIVKLILAFIATQTSRDYPWLAREVVDLADIPLAPEEERHEALFFLEKEHVIEIDRKAGRVRILVPLTAAAVRENALSIREEALLQLRRSGVAS